VSLGAARFRPDPLGMRIDESRQKAHHYLLGRRSPLGGFCFYRSAYLDEPNLFDTWHAVAALALLGDLPPHRDALANFVCAQPPGGQPYELFYRTFTLDILHKPAPDHVLVKEMVNTLPLKLPDPTRHSALSGQMERLLLTIRLKAYFGLAFTAEDIAWLILGLEQSDGGFGTPSNLLDTRLALSILALCGQAASSRTAAFVPRLTLPEFAFRLTQYSLAPTLETVCAGIECCRVLNLPVAYAEDAASFILACQTSNGGFARAPGALPGIELTHLALQGLASLFESSPIHNHNHSGERHD